jgi:membrane-bound metal-dependent hydrolase YbcI (DUF457 family)
VDIETHIVVALALRALLLPSGGWKSAAMTILASILPDLDYYVFAADPLARIVHYGTYGHSELLSPLLAGLAMLPFGRSNYTIRNYSVCLIAILLHLGIDLMGTHGIHVLLPFSSAATHLDLIPNNDALLISILAIGLAVGILFDAVVLRAESSRARKGRIAWSAIAMLCVGAYLIQRSSARENILRLVSAADLTYKDETPERMEVLPVGLFRWRCVAIGDSFVAEFDVDRILGQQEPRFLPRQNPSPAFQAAKQAREIRALADFSEAPLWRYHVQNGATRVELIDLRSGTLARPAYRASALIGPDGTLANSSFAIDGPSWHFRNGTIRRE